MTKRNWIVLLVCVGLLIAGIVAYRATRHSMPVPPPLSTPPSQHQIQSGLQHFVEQRAQIKALKTQIAVYEKILDVAPASKATQQQLDDLRKQLSELENKKTAQ